MTNVDPKRLAKVVKEGGKKGVEIEGWSDMGGLRFFATTVDTPEGDMSLLVECMTAMNAPVDANAEERKGGSGAVGKMIFSYDSDKLNAVGYVPKDLADKVNVFEWMNHTMAAYNGKIICADPDVGTGYICKGQMEADKGNGVFPAKVRDVAVKTSIQYLINKGVFPDDDEDEDESEEEAMGDDFFENLET
ncbi:Uncharacterized protein PBTT_06812 [Plasmodiophora brassicae]|uniref:Uncharacterized protein n=1 Tax=Plasmodiophora brassicae TaxID=37360 RepID=A0A0G4IW07_PLABS|nr:hypothetical protein PBRA_001391 [Plasmodiophora brassicae]SPQ97494.1 unnamed protein product [Plasmodiophora brassicae]